MRSTRNVTRNRLKSNANLKAFVVSTKFVFAKNLIEAHDVEAFLDLLENARIGINDIGEASFNSGLIVPFVLNIGALCADWRSKLSHDCSRNWQFTSCTGIDSSRSGRQLCGFGRQMSG